MSHIEIIQRELTNNPHCSHGPTVLFSRVCDGNRQNFFACAACRDRKECSFYLKEEESSLVSDNQKRRWVEAKKKLIEKIDHRKLFIVLNNILQLPPRSRSYCLNCYEFISSNNKIEHDKHKIVENLDDYKITHPSEILVPLENTRKEAQFLFSKKTVETIVSIIRNCGMKNVICLGTPRIHEHIASEYSDMSTILLDIDKRYHSFFGPLQFCWYNMFNNYFFLPESKQVFYDFLQANGGKDMVLIMDPPFGGRVELLSHTICTIIELYKTLNNITTELPILWIFPYFMEPQILNSLPHFFMSDYKVDYDNHTLFKDGPTGRKQGSPIRIFTNLQPSDIKLPIEEGYKYCEVCRKWVSQENRHCTKCKVCTSKDGRTYVHCNICQRCVKPTWIHCQTCKRCAQPDHICQQLAFTQTCFHCKRNGHKKRDCPYVDREELHQKRKNKSSKHKSKKLKAI